MSGTNVGSKQIQVDTAVLAETALQISAAAGDVNAAWQSVSSSRDANGFGGAPAGEAYENMILRAEPVTLQLMQVLQQLAANVAAAAEGYINTDQGAMPVSYLGYVNPGIHA